MAWVGKSQAHNIYTHGYADMEIKHNNCNGVDHKEIVNDTVLILDCFSILPWQFHVLKYMLKRWRKMYTFGENTNFESHEFWRRSLTNCTSKSICFLNSYLNQDGRTVKTCQLLYTNDVFLFLVNFQKP